MADMSVTSSAAEVADRRKSGRSVRKPVIFSQEHHDGSILSNGSTKRKRPLNGHLPDADDDDLSEESEGDENDDDPDEEELREKRRTARNRKSSGKPAPKKPKTTNGGGATLAIRSANIQRKPASKTAKVQNARARQSQINEDGLYAEVFGRGQSGEEAAAEWLKLLEQDSVTAIRDLVNFILKCTGCDSKVDNFDIEDVDNATSKVGELLEDFQHSGVVEYPLISKLKQHVGFQSVLVEFIKALIKALDRASILYEDPAVFENIQVWVATMSSATFIPCRHTATVISLAMSTALCEIAHSLQQRLATVRAQIETERKKKAVNKGRLKGLEDDVIDNEKKLTTIDECLKDAFDTVFVHRYRDVNERLRVECVTALGNWIVLYRKMFLEGQYLRYLGWVLSDTYPQTRGEVLKQLKTLFKSQKNIAALRAFTERFRPRIVEIGQRDTDQGVRAEAIELLDRLRNAELLEPTDIDTIGQLIFDSEFRVRKSVASFFVSNIEDSFKSVIEDMDEEQLSAALPEIRHEDDYMMPAQAWIKYKCLAESLNPQDGEEQSEKATGTQVFDNMDSRYVLATQAIFPHMEELQDWEGLAGYLLYDHSGITGEADDADVALAVRTAYRLAPGEETALLDVLYCAVKLHLLEIAESQGEKKGKKTKASKDEIQERQEAAAQSLNSIIPQLLSKFGGVPHTAAAILRLEQLLNIDLIADMQQGDAATTALLEDINKQFTSHSDQAVLTEAKMAFHEARKYEQSKEAAEIKIQEVWEGAASLLQILLKGQNIDTRGTLSTTILTEINNTVSRMASLTSIWDCSSALEDKLAPMNRKSKAKVSHASLLELLLAMARRGVPDEDTTELFARLEDEVCSSVITILGFYFRWKAYLLKTSLSTNNLRQLTPSSLSDLATRRVAFIEVITPIIVNRTPLDPIRVLAVNLVPEIFTLFASMRNVKPTKGPALSEELVSNLTSLIVQVPDDLQASIMQTHDKLEKVFAKRTRRKIEKGPAPDVAEDAAPADSDDEDDDDEEEDPITADMDRESRKRTIVLMERNLCELTSKIVLAVVGGIMDQRVKEALQRNRTRLGRDYAAVVAYLDVDRKSDKGKSKGQAGKAKLKEAAPKSTMMVLEDDDIEDEEMEGDEEQGEDAGVQNEEEEPIESSVEPEEVIGD
jgi:cohesin complex subunit SA-1/2